MKAHLLSVALVAAMTAAAAQDYSTGLGAWRGPVQFNFTEGGVRDAAAHNIVPMVIELEPDERVRGVASDTGCTFLGLARQLNVPTVWTLDVTASACTDAKFNRRYSGTLSVYAGPKQANLYLASIGIPAPGRKASSAELSATLKR